MTTSTLPSSTRELGGGEQPRDGELAVRAQLRGTLQGAHRRGHRAAPAGIVSRAVQGRGDGFVGSVAAGGLMPGAAVWRVFDDGGDRGVRGAALGLARRLIERGADQRVTEAHAGAVALEQPCGDRGLDIGFGRVRRL